MAKGSCFQSPQVTEVCDICREPAEVMHLPLRPLGLYCERHCPACCTPSATKRAILQRRIEVTSPIVERRMVRLA
jgi:hypothetical protein